MEIKAQPDSVFDDIYRKAAPYLDTRRNDIHVSLSCDFGRRLLALYPKADEEIVLPAIVLHDVGWKMVPEGKQLKRWPRQKVLQVQRKFEKPDQRKAADSLAYHRIRQKHNKRERWSNEKICR